MTSTPFGRRTPQPQPQRRDELSAEAQAFRAQIASRAGAPSAFQAWKRERRAGRRVAWLATFALMTPGLACFVLHAPSLVSAALEVGGIGAGAWLRRERRKHLDAIRSWEEDDRSATRG